MRSFQASWAAALRARSSDSPVRNESACPRQAKGRSKGPSKRPSTCPHARCLAPFSLEQDDWLCERTVVARLAAISAATATGRRSGRRLRCALPYGPVVQSITRPSGEYMPRLALAIRRAPGSLTQARGWPASLTMLSSQPFWVTKAKSPGRTVTPPWNALIWAGQIHALRRRLGCDQRCRHGNRT